MRINDNLFETGELDWLSAAATMQSPSESLQAMADRYPGKVVFSTSFSMEDQVIAHFIFSHQINIRVFTLDTGRLFPETYSTWSQTIEQYGQPIDVYYPEATDLEPFLRQKGPNSFYDSVENRKECCHIRKVLPLRRAIAGQQLWVTGIRAEHSPNRTEMEKVEWDAGNQLYKFHPLLNWTMEELQAFVKQNQVPVNPLHGKGFVSIGCAPCTRAIRPGEDFRAGRWWWEDADKKECGLHVHAS